MSKAISVGLLLSLCVSFTFGYPRECARGPEYWCQTFVTASECGALRHCTDTVWKYQQEESKDESTTCNLCQNILTKSYETIQNINSNDALAKSSLLKSCQSFQRPSVSAQCTAVMTTYSSSVLSLLKNQRYHTLCRLINACDVEEQETTTPKLTLIGSKRCTWGPGYWCSSLQNAHECQSVEHCSNKVWSKQSVDKKDNICQYCEFTLTKLRHMLDNNETDIAVDKYLTGACSMLPTRGEIDQCVKMLSDYSEQLLALLKTKIDPSVICHLTHMCKDSELINTKINEVPQVGQIVDGYDTMKEEKQPLDDETKMLCSVLVRATADLFNSGKQQKEIQLLIRDDCSKLETTELIEKCQNSVDTYEAEIYRHVANNVDLSKICSLVEGYDWLPEKEQQTGQLTTDVECKLCTLVVSTAKRMLETKHSEDSVIRYIEEQMCSRLQSLDKKACQNLLQKEGQEMLNTLTCGTHPMLLCTYFKVCTAQIALPSSPLEKEEVINFLKNEICEKLGPLKDTCIAVISDDVMGAIRLLINDLDPSIVCEVFGLCPKKLTFLDNWAVHDDKNKCKRCIDDFTRRKHIAERLITRAAQFMQHFCGQLPQKDECEKQVNASISELVKYIQSLDPQSICVEIKMCNQTMALSYKSDYALTDNVINAQLLRYAKTHVCKKLESLDTLCEQLVDVEGPKLLVSLSNNVDPHRVCQVLGICPSDKIIAACADKCQCCMDKVEQYESQATAFIQSMVSNVKTFCGHLPVSTKCAEVVDSVAAQINSYISTMDSKRICQTLRFCPVAQVEYELNHDRCPDCQNQLESKRTFLLSSVNKVSNNLKTLCEYIPWEKDCQTIIDRSILTVNEKIEKINANKWCLQNQFCPKTSTSQNLEIDLEKYLQAEICSKGDQPFYLLCRQLISFNKTKNRMEALFTSMFNQNGQLEGSQLCELDEQSNGKECKPCEKAMKDCNDKCDCCVKFYDKKKTYDLKQIETLRFGLLATCDWSLSKTQCVNWFNRVCDRMKAKVDQFDPTKFCKRIGLCPLQIVKTSPLTVIQTVNDEQKCESGDKCQCCTDRIQQRKDCLKSLINRISSSLISLCAYVPWDKDCKDLITSAQQRSLDTIEKLDPKKVCQRLGFCPVEQSSRYQLPTYGQKQYSQLDSLNERLETYMENEVCQNYGILMPLCKHIFANVNSQDYEKVYLAIITNNIDYIRQDIEEKLAKQKQLNNDTCQGCKNAVQTIKEFWIQATDTVSSALIRTCEWCPVKDECRNFYTKNVDNIKNYLNKIDPQQWCQTIHLCQTTSLIVTDNKCEQCTVRLQNRKDCFLRATDRLTSYFDTLCKQFSGQQCQNFVKELSDQGKEWVQKFDPKETCQYMGFCVMQNGDNELQQDRSFDEYEKQFQSRMEEICSKLGPFNSICQQIARGNMNEIQTTKINYNIKDLMELGEKNIFTATFIDECPKEKCECCIKRIKCKVAHAKELLHELTQTLSSLCDYCPVKRRCIFFFKKREEHIDKCLDSLRPRRICTKAGFCPNTTEENTPESLIIENIVSDGHGQSAVSTNVYDSNQTCIMCEFVMNLLKSYIKKNSTEQEIEQSLDKICQEMPSSLKQECLTLVENYSPTILSILAQEFDPSSICQKLRVCTAQLSQRLNTQYLTKASPSSCGICDYFSTYLHFAIQRDPSETSIRKALETVCTHLGVDKHAECETLVALYTPQIVSGSVKLEMGNNFCNDLKICQKPMIELTPGIETPPQLIHIPLTRVETPVNHHLSSYDIKQILDKNIDADPECTICHYVVSYLDAILKNNKSEAAIEAALARVCSILPVKERGQCDQFVKNYGPVLAELIAEFADPQTVCRYLGMCQVILPESTTTATKKPSSTTSVYDNHQYVDINVPTSSHLNSPFTCTICTYVVSRLKYIIIEDKTEEKIMQELDKTCGLFSALDLRRECKTFVDEYGPYLVQVISQDVDAKVACQNLKICPKSELQLPWKMPTKLPDVKLPSSSISTKKPYPKCIFGMSYWCTSRENAQLCNAVEICESQVWSKQKQKTGI